MAEFKKGSIRRIQLHVMRERLPRTNPDVDPSRSELNYSLLDRARQVMGAVREKMEKIGKRTPRGIRLLQIRASVICAHDSPQSVQ
jgi:hypothetical protein